MAAPAAAKVSNTIARSGLGGGFAAAALFMITACAADETVGESEPPAETAADRAVPPPPGPQTTRPSSSGPSDDFVSRDEMITAFHRSLRHDPPAGFADLWIRRGPSFAVIVNAKPPFDPEDYLARADASLRPLIRFAEVSRTRSEISQTEDRIIASWRDIDQPWSGGYEVQRDVFRYTAASQETLEQMRAALPTDLRDQVELGRETQPEPMLR